MPTSIVTVPVFGFGIRPRGPRMRPSLPTLPIWSGVAIATSNSVKPSSICFARSAEPDDVRAGLLRLARLVALGEDGDPDFLAAPVREHEGAAQLLVGVADVETEAEVQLDRLVELRRAHRLEQADGLDRRVELLAVEAGAGVAIALAVLCH